MGEGPSCSLYQVVESLGQLVIVGSERLRGRTVASVMEATPKEVICAIAFVRFPLASAPMILSLRGGVVWVRKSRGGFRSGVTVADTCVRPQGRVNRLFLVRALWVVYKGRGGWRSLQRDVSRGGIDALTVRRVVIDAVARCDRARCVKQVTNFFRRGPD